MWTIQQLTVKAIQKALCSTGKGNKLQQKLLRGQKQQKHNCQQSEWHTFLYLRLSTPFWSEWQTYNHGIFEACLLQFFSTALLVFFLFKQQRSIWLKYSAVALTAAHLSKGCLFYYCCHCEALQTGGSANCQKCNLNGSVRRSSHLPC